MNYKNIIEEWKKLNICTVEELEEKLENFRILFAYHSGVIENPEITYHNTREIFENGKVINFTGDTRTIFEMQNQKICFDYLKTHVVEKDDLNPELIKSIHKKLCRGCYDQRRYERGERPGEYKKHDYVVGDNQGALPEEVADEIEELCDELQEIPDKGDNVLKAAAYLHCEFENTHPFADGNGRVGRTLMNYFLMIHDVPPIIVYNEHKDRYYKALGYYDQTGDIKPFVEYMKSEMEVTWLRTTVQQRNLESILELEK